MLYEVITMRRMLAGRGRAVMAAYAGADHLGVVDEVGRRPEDIVVAVLADIGRVDVGRSLAGRIRAVVAVGAVAGDVHVIEVRRDPRVRRVAIVAVGATGDVVRGSYNFV